MIRARVNGEEQELPDGITLRAVVERFGFHPEAVAVAVDGHVVRRAQLAERVLAGGEQVEIIRAVGGG